MSEETIYNRMEKVLTEWVCLHDEDKHFEGWEPGRPAIKLCHRTFRVRANDAWSKLPLHLKEATVAHEIGHREMGHASIPQDNPFYRMGFVLIHQTVDPKELEADRFACKLIGTDKYLIALRGMLSLNRRTNAPAVAVREYEYRIKAIEERNLA